AADALSNVESMKRDISCLIVGLSQRGFETVKSKIQKFRKELADIVDKDERAEKVYHLNFQLFPTSNSDKGKT
ncbi:MAG: TIGR02147 family protein, partial [Planctomycetes bacterium]|nr:TIGR02147 family protein [Planctomycetota bacterium]